MKALMNRLGLAAAAVGVLLLGWGLWPLPRHTYTAGIGTTRLVFTVPTAVRLGDAPTARLEVIPPPAEAATRTEAGFRLRRLVARLTFNGVQVTPPGEVNLTVGQAAPVRLTWRVQALAVGNDVGSLWVYQVFPDGSRMARLTYPLHLRVRTFLGLSGSEARLLGFFAVFVAAVLAFAARR